MRAAGLGQGGEEGGQHPFVQVACRQVVQEEKGLRPLGQEVVDRVVDQVKAEPRDVPCFQGQEGFGAHAVRGGHQNRFL